MKVHRHDEDRKFRLWLPLFLLLPLALVLVIILFPVILVAMVIFRLTGRRRHSVIVGTLLRTLCSPRAMKAAFDVLCSTPGLRVAVINRNERVNISII